MSLIKVNNLSSLDGSATREVTANTGLTIPAGEDLKIQGSIIDSTGSDGNTGQYLTAINGGSQVSWTSLPQSLSPTASVTFANITVTGDITIQGNANFGLLDEIETIIDIVSNNPLSDLVVDNITTALEISNINVEQSGSSVVTTTTDHSFVVGDRISIKNSSNGDLNGVYRIVSNPAPTQSAFTIFVDTAEIPSGIYSGGTTAPVAVFTGDVVIDGSLSLNGTTTIGLSGDTASAATFGASGDAEEYDVQEVSIETTSSFNYIKLRVEDVSKFSPNHQVKVFGVSKTNLSTIPPNPPPTSATAIVGDSLTFNISTKKWYAYATADYNLINGWYTSADSASTCVCLNVITSVMDSSNYNSIAVSKNSGNGTLLYRAEFNTQNEALIATTLASEASYSNFKLIAVLGPREYGNSNSLTYNDFGDFNITTWSTRNNNGSYSSPVHFKASAQSQNQQGFVTSGIFNIDESDDSFWLSVPSLYADANFTASKIKIYHDDTKPLQDAIDAAASSGKNYILIPGGTYLVSQLKIPSSFTLKGFGDATIIKKQYWDTQNVNSSVQDGAKASIIVSSSYNNSIPEINPTTGENIWGLKKVSIADITFDGNSSYQIQYGGSSLGEDANNSLLHLVNSEFVRIQNTKIIYSSGSSIFATGSKNLTINSSIIIDGCDIEFYASPCVIAEDCESTIISNCAFQNYPGPVNLSSTNVLSVNGCTVRNCGTGIRIYGSSKTDVLNNLILGPADEYIPVPETTDTEYNGVNISVIPGNDGFTPVYQYNISGQPVDLSEVVPNLIKFDVYPVNIVGGLEIIDFDNPIRDSGNNPLYTYFNPELSDNPELGQVRFKIPSSKSGIISLVNPPAPNRYNVYEVTAIKYTNIGSDIDQVLIQGTALSIPNGIGALSSDVGKNSYALGVTESMYFSVVAGDFIKLVAHDYSTNVGNPTWKVAAKRQLSTTQFQLFLLPFSEDLQGDLDELNFGSVTPSPSNGGGYAKFREVFSIARGIVSIV
jgi:hypothetical protein